jgi:hypothetical protein
MLGKIMKKSSRYRQAGKLGWAVLWLIGVPIPVLLALEPISKIILGCPD